MKDLVPPHDTLRAPRAPGTGPFQGHHGGCLYRPACPPASSAPCTGPRSEPLMTTSGLRAHFLTADGAFLRYLDIPGAGPPLVWIHGWQCSSTGELLPAAVQPPLRNRRSLLVDLLGHGYSDKPVDFSYTVVDHARTVVDLIEALGFDECGLVGHSMGGEICIRVASALPGVVTLLVMAEGTLDPHGEEVFDGQTEDEFAETGFAALLESMRTRGIDDPSGVPAAHLGLTSLIEPR